jgi:hypothetical protein
MARLPSLVVAGLPHHSTQRCNGQAQTFFGDADDALYRGSRASSCRAAEVEVFGVASIHEYLRTSGRRGFFRGRVIPGAR